MAADFKLEKRYIILKRKHLNSSQIQVVDEWYGHCKVDGLVIEKDWPEYQTVLQMLGDRVTGVSNHECVNTADIGMTDNELAIIKSLADVWNEFLSLPVEHSQDQSEFCTIIHSLQRMILARPSRRQLKKLHAREIIERLTRQ